MGVVCMMFRRKKSETGPELSREEMEELVDENIQFARKYANEGNVSGMEMSLEVVMQYGQKLGRSLDSQEMAEIKLMGYERGTKVMQERAAELQKEGKIREAQNAARLASTYGDEARMLKYTL
jgi:soluble cytochrome b562